MLYIIFSYIIIRHWKPLVTITTSLGPTRKANRHFSYLIVGYYSIISSCCTNINIDRSCLFHEIVVFLFIDVYDNDILP